MVLHPPNGVMVSTAKEGMVGRSPRAAAGEY